MERADFFQQSYIRRRTAMASKPWEGILKYKVPNPAFVDKPEGEDTRKSEQRRREVWKQRTRVFDPETVRTKTQAMQALAAWKAEEERDAWAVDALMPVAEYVERYIDSREAAGELEASTVCDYHKSAKRVSEAFSKLPMRDLDRKGVRAWKDGLVSDGLAPSTVTKALRLLRMVCEQAVMDGDLSDNPCQGVRAPSLGSGKRARNALSDSSMDRLMTALEGADNTPFSTAVQLAVRTGMRQGEICALRWRDVDLVGGHIHITHAIGQNGGQFYVKAPKNEGSTRSITISPDLGNVLVARKEAVEDALASGGMRRGQRGYEAAFGALFVVGSIDGSFYTPTILSREWKALAVALGIVDTEGKRATFHDLRHTYATLAISQGQDVAGVAGNLGHSQISTTLNMYTTSKERSKASAMGAVEKALRGHAPARVIPLRGNGTDGQRPLDF
ncbi:site-specific recombinase, phage integrase family [Coriobacteriaceae bacterium BV3Ac1]|nr:site-specific recombinase, phage integrase family [Coriobacteriaceae bacterium BV3Ac1]